ncbi:MAG: hypothetical protein DMG34_03215 [Acidobacteria bacterium]|nr:MAG: hypothetical protein DMG34_03215 [Acidobacteriota bacterium]
MRKFNPESLQATADNRSDQTSQPAMTKGLSMNALSQEFHHAQFLVPLAEKANAHLEHPLVYVLGELLDIRIAEFRAGKNRARSAAQLGFWRQFAIQFLPWHLHDPTKFYAYQGKVIR